MADDDVLGRPAEQLSDDELAAIDVHALDAGVNIWAARSSDL